MLRGINHVTFAVRDLDATLRVYDAAFDLRPVARWPGGAYLEAGTLWIALIVDETARAEPLAEYTHVAFDVAPADFRAAAARAIAAGAVVWRENRSEGQSLYVLDPNGHKLELHASDLAARLASLRASPRPGLEVLRA